MSYPTRAEGLVNMIRPADRREKKRGNLFDQMLVIALNHTKVSWFDGRWGCANSLGPHGMFNGSVTSAVYKEILWLFMVPASKTLFDKQQTNKKEKNLINLPIRYCFVAHW